MKRIGLLLASIFGILFVGVSLANPIAPTIYCHTFKNVEIDNYKVIIEHDKEIYEAKAKECTKCFNSRNFISSRVYLLNKDIDIGDITNENIQNKAIFLGEINDFECSDSYYDKVNTYKITKDGSSYKIELSKTTDEQVKRKIKNNLNVFPYARFITIVIETIVLFFISKFNWKVEQISNKKIIIFGIIPTTISLPLFWFILPLFMGIGIWYTIVGELFVILLETIIIKYGLSISRGKAIEASVLCNVASLILGALILEWLDGLVY